MYKSNDLTLSLRPISYGDIFTSIANVQRKRLILFRFHNNLQICIFHWATCSRTQKAGHIGCHRGEGQCDRRTFHDRAEYTPRQHCDYYMYLDMPSRKLGTLFRLDSQKLKKKETRLDNIILLCFNAILQ